MAEKASRNFCIFWSQRVLNATVQMKVFIFTMASNTLWIQKNAEISTCFFCHVVSLRWIRMLHIGFWRHAKVFDGFGPNLRPKKFCTKKAEIGSGGTKICIFFVRNFCSLCLWMQILYGGVSHSKRAGRSKVCIKTSLNLTRHFKSEILHPPVNKWRPSFKFLLGHEGGSICCMKNLPKKAFGKFHLQVMFTYGCIFVILFLLAVSAFFRTICTGFQNLSLPRLQIYR